MQLISNNTWMVSDDAKKIFYWFKNGIVHSKQQVDNHKKRIYVM